MRGYLRACVCKPSPPHKTEQNTSAHPQSARTEKKTRDSIRPHVSLAVAACSARVHTTKQYQKIPRENASHAHTSNKHVPVHISRAPATGPSSLPLSPSPFSHMEQRKKEEGEILLIGVTFFRYVGAILGTRSQPKKGKEGRIEEKHMLLLFVTGLL